MMKRIFGRFRAAVSTATPAVVAATSSKRIVRTEKCFLISMLVFGLGLQVRNRASIERSGLATDM
jgi:hypothetical protein